MLLHNSEAYSSRVYHPMAEGISVEGIFLVKQYLPAAASGQRMRWHILWDQFAMPITAC